MFNNLSPDSKARYIRTNVAAFDDDIIESADQAKSQKQNVRHKDVNKPGEGSKSSKENASIAVSDDTVEVHNIFTADIHHAPRTPPEAVVDTYPVAPIDVHSEDSRNNSVQLLDVGLHAESEDTSGGSSANIAPITRGDMHTVPTADTTLDVNVNLSPAVSVLESHNVAAKDDSLPSVTTAVITAPATASKNDAATSPEVPILPEGSADIGVTLPSTIAVQPPQITQAKLSMPSSSSTLLVQKNTEERKQPVKKSTASYQPIAPATTVSATSVNTEVMSQLLTNPTSAMASFLQSVGIMEPAAVVSSTPPVLPVSSVSVPVQQQVNPLSIGVMPSSLAAPAPAQNITLGVVPGPVSAATLLQNISSLQIPGVTPMTPGLTLQSPVQQQCATANQMPIVIQPLRSPFVLGTPSTQRSASILPSPLGTPLGTGNRTNVSPMLPTPILPRPSDVNKSPGVKAQNDDESSVTASMSEKMSDDNLSGFGSLPLSVKTADLEGLGALSPGGAVADIDMVGNEESGSSEKRKRDDEIIQKAKKQKTDEIEGSRDTTNTTEDANKTNSGRKEKDSGSVAGSSSSKSSKRKRDKMRFAAGKENQNVSMDDDNGFGEHQCPVCKKNFASKIVLRTHSKTAHPETKAFYCDHPGCKVKCTTLMRLRLHKQQAHRVKLDSVASALAVNNKRKIEKEVKVTVTPSSQDRPENSDERDRSLSVTLFRLEDHPYIKMDLFKRYGKIVRRRKNRSKTPLLAPKPYIMDSAGAPKGSRNHREFYDIDINLSHDKSYEWNGYKIQPGPVSSKPWNKYYSKPGPASSKPKKPKAYRPGPACTKRRTSKVKGDSSRGTSGTNSPVTVLPSCNDKDLASGDAGKDDKTKVKGSSETPMEVQESATSGTIDTASSVSTGPTEDLVKNDVEVDKVQTLQEYDSSDDANAIGIKSDAKDSSKTASSTGSTKGTSEAQSSTNTAVPSEISNSEFLQKLSNDEMMEVLTAKKCICACGHIITDSLMFNIHRTIHAASNPLKCSECNTVFEDFELFQKHLVCN